MGDQRNGEPEETLKAFSLFSLRKWSIGEDSISFVVLKWQLQRRQMLYLYEQPHGVDKVQIAPEEVSSKCMNIFCHENTWSLVQPPQGWGRVPTPVGFQDAVIQDIRKPQVVLLSQERLDQMIIWGPFLCRQFFKSVKLICVEYAKCSNVPDIWGCQSRFIPPSNVFAVIRQGFLIFNCTTVFLLLIKCSAGIQLKITGQVGSFKVELEWNHVDREKFSLVKSNISLTTSEQHLSWKAAVTAT